MNTKLILVSGRSGSGKSTLIQAALRKLNGLVYLTTTTTRPPRSGEESGVEYDFVSDQIYEATRLGSPNWDYTEYQGHSYGADIGCVLEQLQQGNSVICSVAPRIDVVEQMAMLYMTKPVTLWLEVDPSVLKARIAPDQLRSARLEDDHFMERADYVFRPSGILHKDAQIFTKLISAIIDT